MAEESYYELLQATPTADLEIITAAYRALISRHHPDTTGHSLLAHLPVLPRHHDLLTGQHKQPRHLGQSHLRASCSRPSWSL